MTHPLTATFIIELNATVTGNYIPYVPATGPSYSSGGEPAEGGFCEDVAIDGLTISVRSGERETMTWKGFDSLGIETHLSTSAPKWKEVDILKDIDTSNPEVQKLLANILSCVEEEAQEELREAVGEDREYEPEDGTFLEIED